MDLSAAEKMIEINEDDISINPYVKKELCKDFFEQL